MIKLTDDLYSKASKYIREKMIVTFNTAFVWEYRFWNDAYNLDDFYNV